MQSTVALNKSSNDKLAGFNQEAKQWKIKILLILF